MIIAKDELTKREESINKVIELSNNINIHKCNPVGTLTYLLGLYSGDAEKIEAINDILKGQNIPHLKEMSWAHYHALLKEVPLSKLVSISDSTIDNIKDSVESLLLASKELVNNTGTLFDSELIKGNLELIKEKELFRIDLAKGLLDIMNDECKNLNGCTNGDYIAYMFSEPTLETMNDDRKYMIADYDNKIRKINMSIAKLSDDVKSGTVQSSSPVEVTDEPVLEMIPIDANIITKNDDVEQYTTDTDVMTMVNLLSRVMSTLNILSVEINTRLTRIQETLSKVTNTVDNKELSNLLGEISNKYIESNISKDEHKLHSMVLVNILKKTYNADKAIVTLMTNELSVVLEESFKYKLLLTLFKRAMHEGTSKLWLPEVKRGM